MKVINNLVVVEVPKGAVMHRILGSTVQWDSNEHMADTHADIPPGQYEIIGVKSSMNELSNRDFLLMILKIQKAGKDYARTESLYEFLLKNGINIETLENDLLFIHKLK